MMAISDVDLDWHMHEVSDGERRRVQIVSGLMAPWEMLLLDEVSLSLSLVLSTSSKRKLRRGKGRATSWERQTEY